MFVATQRETDGKDFVAQLTFDMVRNHIPRVLFCPFTLVHLTPRIYPPHDAMESQARVLEQVSALSLQCTEHLQEAIVLRAEANHLQQLLDSQVSRLQQTFRELLPSVVDLLLTEKIPVSQC